MCSISASRWLLGLSTRRQRSNAKLHVTFALPAVIDGGREAAAITRVGKTVWLTDSQQAQAHGMDGGTIR